MRLLLGAVSWSAPPVFGLASAHLLAVPRVMVAPSATSSGCCMVSSVSVVGAMTRPWAKVSLPRPSKIWRSLLSFVSVTPAPSVMFSSASKGVPAAAMRVGFTWFVHVRFAPKSSMTTPPAATPGATTWLPKPSTLFTP